MADYLNTTNIEDPSDLDVRRSVHNIIYGTEESRPRGRWVVIQSVLTDENGHLIKSPYSYKSTGESNGKYPATTLTGYLCDEKLARTVIFTASSNITLKEIQMDAATLGKHHYLAYISHKDKVKRGDVLVTIELDDAGDIVSPVKALKSFVVGNIVERRIDSGRLEYSIAVLEPK